MNTQTHKSRMAWRTGLLIVIVLLSLLSTVTAAQAVYRTINLNDDTLDPQWQATPVYTSNCSNGSINNQDEIKNAWITNRDPAGANGGWYYFRIETCAAPALSTSSILAAVQFDCNNDGDFTDPAGSPPNFGDRKVAYSAGADFTYYLSGTNVNLGGGSDPATLSPSCNTELYHGERPSGSNANVEWGFQFCDMPPGCRGGDDPPIPIHFQIGTGNTSGAVIDQSPVFEYTSPPTAVTLLGFRAASPLWENTTILWTTSALSLILLGVLIIVRRRVKAG
jgi:hypothetical protein